MKILNSVLPSIKGVDQPPMLRHASARVDVDDSGREHSVHFNTTLLSGRCTMVDNACTRKLGS